MTNEWRTDVLENFGAFGRNGRSAWPDSANEHLDIQQHKFGDPSVQMPEALLALEPDPHLVPFFKKHFEGIKRHRGHLRQ